MTIYNSKVIVSVVGDNMRHVPGITGKIFGVLGKYNINVSAIAQGSSERNVSLVVDQMEENKVLKIIHKTFFKK